MKTIPKIFMIIALFFAGNMLVAQDPDGFNYQAVIRDSSGEKVSNSFYWRSTEFATVTPW